MQAALSLRSDAHLLSQAIFLCFSPITFLSPFISLILSRVPPSFSNYPLPPPSQFEIPACHTLIRIYFPLRAITLRGLIFFLLSYSWTFERQAYVHVWRP